MKFCLSITLKSLNNQYLNQQVRLKQDIKKIPSYKKGLSPRQCTVLQGEENFASYSPDLATSDLYLIAYLKKLLTGKEFESKDEVIAEAEAQR